MFVKNCNAMKINSLATFILLFSTYSGLATTHQVGPGGPYLSPNALYTANVVQDGDTIEIAAATYVGTACLAVWQPHNLLIRGVGGRPQMLADGQYIWGKGIWVLAGNDITVENIEFTGATVPDQNGAGIRLDGTGLTVRHCYFHDNENGILTSNPNAGEVLIEYSEFAYNGYGDGYSHNLYIGHVDKLTFRYNYSHHAKVGHNLKSRARENLILYNRIMDEETGNSSRLIDLPNGGLSIVMGNLLMQGELAENNNLVGYGLEGLNNEGPHEFYLVNNTLVNKRVASCIFVAIQDGTSTAKLVNNIFAGTGTLLNGNATTETNNFLSPEIASAGFVDEANYDYHLLPNSTAIDYGTALPLASGHSLTPDYVYEHPTTVGPRPMVGAAIDAGAYEYGLPSAVAAPVAQAPIFYPNPTTGVLNINGKVERLLVFDAMGRQVLSANAAEVDLSALRSGLYWVLAQMGDGHFSERVLKL
jgi:Right handed beta helix region/Secretion system C-terminal sorting domain